MWFLHVFYSVFNYLSNGVFKSIIRWSKILTGQKSVILDFGLSHVFPIEIGGAPKLISFYISKSCIKCIQTLFPAICPRILEFKLFRYTYSFQVQWNLNPTICYITLQRTFLLLQAWVIILPKHITACLIIIIVIIIDLFNVSCYL